MTCGDIYMGISTVKLGTLGAQNQWHFIDETHEHYALFALKSGTPTNNKHVVFSGCSTISDVSPDFIERVDE